MMEAAGTSETLVNFYQTTWHYNSEDSHLHTSIKLDITAMVSKGKTITDIQVQGVHMKCIPFYCKISHEPKGRGMKTKCI
jgi:hypothetical protein